MNKSRPTILARALIYFQWTLIFAALDVLAAVFVVALAVLNTFDPPRGRHSANSSPEPHPVYRPISTFTAAFQGVR